MKKIHKRTEGKTEEDASAYSNTKSNRHH